MSRYAVCIADLADVKARGDWLLPQFVINAETRERGEIIWGVKGQPDTQSVVLQQPEEQAQAICELIRYKYRKHQVRIYINKTGRSWRPMP